VAVKGLIDKLNAGPINDPFKSRADQDARDLSGALSKAHARQAQDAEKLAREHDTLSGGAYARQRGKQMKPVLPAFGHATANGMKPENVEGYDLLNEAVGVKDL
jgi:hypothetical protein